MFVELIGLALIGATWVALLWLAIDLDFSQWSNLHTIALHLLPPLLLWLAWVGVRRHRHRQQEREQAHRREQEAATKAAAKEAARRKHEEEMARRRFGCDCRALAISTTVTSDDPPLVTSDLARVDVEVRLPGADASPPDAHALAKLEETIAEILSKLYGNCGAAPAFPIYVLPPAEVSGEEIIKAVRTARAAMVATLDLPLAKQASAAPVLFLPAADNAASSVVALFEAEPRLPGAIVLALDSPLSRATQEEDEFAPSEQSTQAKLAGKPGEAVVGMLLTHPALPDMLRKVADVRDQSMEKDSMTPFWDKSSWNEPGLALLASLPGDLRSDLAEIASLARIHRPFTREWEQPASSVLGMTKVIQMALEQVQINAGMIDLPFTHEPSEGASSDTSSETKEHQDAPATRKAPPRCERLIHDAGSVDYAGKRLAALGTAMFHFQMEIDPVDSEVSMNSVAQIGDLGRATDVVQLALAVAHAAGSGASALLTQFIGKERFAATVVVPRH